MPTSLPKIRLTLAFPPSATLKRRLAAWLKKETGRKASWEIKTDKKILGGLILIFNGHYRNFSLKRELDEKLSKLS
ncbi:hypothetical protein FJZ40_00565 [Candidatus Shapirobacteria bacterium]|nr:hypothetical protein [Candidatus Shapirobacteria bacterium]